MLKYPQGILDRRAAWNLCAIKWFGKLSLRNQASLHGLFERIIPMQTLWSPWRMKYMMNQEKSDECIFCRALKQTDGPENLIVMRGKKAFVILNRFPYTTGHVMIVPYAHIDTIEGLEVEARAEIMELMTEMMILLRELY